MSFRDRLGMFVLTKQEQRTIVFVVLMLVLGLATKHYRAQHQPNERAEPTYSPLPSPSPGIRP